jgi:hypothetical protein
MNTVSVEKMPISELLELQKLKGHPVSTVRLLAGLANQELCNRLSEARTDLHRTRLALQHKENIVRELRGFPLIPGHGVSDDVDDPDATDFQPW